MNEKLTQAYEYLDLPEDIRREELDRRFNLLLKRQRSNSDERDTTYEEEFRAFKFILDELDQREIMEAEDRRFAKWGRQANAARRVESFFRLYKIHTVISIIVLIVLVVGGNALYKNGQEKKYLASLPPVDAKIMFLGNFASKDPKNDNDELNKAIVKQYPAWKRVEASIVNLPSTGNSVDTLDMTYIQRAVVELAANTPDILIMDEVTLAWIGQQKGLQSLEEIVSDGKLASDDIRLKSLKDEGSGQDVVVGIDITDTSFASGLPINSLKMIVGVLAADEKKQKAMEFIVHVLSETAVQ
ncbi:hypothetical protein [Paenibacillus macquariensis]|uniref:J domain-containing protein n=1 Tax=Paenibacillus macquariensis TaxID=948756 RepID=A0ABY1JLE4_9BACL|nr:hypothetical protein [Paenibacillus macquariensis]MEC0090131.1 hypothetical protein [Paenibacillus macquariensis]OAB31000.1 hypothetical protein PMSM_19905 [Paenibacillus macquariensis subsp. macquariensis]SIQ38251.1 hypothetical protein SAMN05421578_101519 [Paenibacillus macquariensis]